MKESKKSRTNNLNLWIILWESINVGKRRKRKEMKKWPFEAFPGITILLSCLQLCKIVGSKSRYLTVFSCSSSMGKKKKYIGRCLWKRRKDISSDSLQSQEMSLINLLLIWFFKPGTSRLQSKHSKTTIPDFQQKIIVFYKFTPMSGTHIYNSSLVTFACVT